MNSIDEKIKTSLRTIREEFKELMRGGNVDPLLLKKEIESLINCLRPKGKDYGEVEKEAEDMLIDLTFMIQEGRCTPFRARFKR